jgi:BirA family biotin operon repressor/biotin-[acetyl-CoA-carboxylase] ligase
VNNTYFIKQTHSTNALLWELLRKENLPEGFSLLTDFQTAGKGQIGNSWEAEKGKNLLFSMLLFPHKIAPEEQFVLSQLVCLSIKRVLSNYVDNITVKWPNDIYWNDKKLGGILIENVLQGNNIKTAVVGIGLNVNQKLFKSNAPNPVSLVQIANKRFNRKLIFNQIREEIQLGYNNLNIPTVRAEYSASLYRKEGFHSFTSDNESFEARIVRVDSDGQLVLETKAGEEKKFYFKEVSFTI